MATFLNWIKLGYPVLYTGFHMKRMITWGPSPYCNSLISMFNTFIGETETSHKHIDLWLFPPLMEKRHGISRSQTNNQTKVRNPFICIFLFSVKSVKSPFFMGKFLDDVWDLPWDLPTLPELSASSACQASLTLPL